jgi:hypothetical protein
MMNWYVVYTKPKWEWSQLKNKGSSLLLPLLRRFTMVWSKEKVEVPLFNSYVLSSCLKHNEIWFFNLGVVLFVLLGKPAIVRDEEIDTIQNGWSSSGQWC